MKILLAIEFDSLKPFEIKKNKFTTLSRDGKSKDLIEEQGISSIDPKHLASYRAINSCPIAEHLPSFKAPVFHIETRHVARASENFRMLILGLGKQFSC